MIGIRSFPTLDRREQWDNTFRVPVPSPFYGGKNLNNAWVDSVTPARSGQRTGQGVGGCTRDHFLKEQACN